MHRRRMRTSGRARTGGYENGDGHGRDGHSDVRCDGLGDGRHRDGHRCDDRLRDDRHYGGHRHDGRHDRAILLPPSTA